MTASVGPQPSAVLIFSDCGSGCRLAFGIKNQLVGARQTERVGRLKVRRHRFRVKSSCHHRQASHELWDAVKLELLGLSIQLHFIGSRRADRINLVERVERLIEIIDIANLRSVQLVF